MPMIELTPGRAADAEGLTRGTSVGDGVDSVWFGFGGVDANGRSCDRAQAPIMSAATQ